MFVIVCDEVREEEARNCLASVVGELAFPLDAWEERRLIENKGG